VKRLAAGLLLALVWAQPLRGQASCFGGTVDDDGACSFAAPRWVGEFASLSANGVIGGLTAGLIRHFRGGSFRDGFVRGMAGGAASWAGKRIAAESFDGAGLIGRGVSAAGASMARNAGIGATTFDRLMFPIGPLWLDVSPGRRALRVRVDVVALAWLTYAAVEPELRLDGRATLSAGAPVFRTDGKLISFGNDEVHAAGVTNAGVILLAGIPAYGPEFERRAMAHERIHVLQEDQLAILWSDPGVSRVTGLSASGRLANRYVAWNFGTEVLRVAGYAFPQHGDRPWELEAIFFAR
jgi:hypothetical protein